MNEKEIMLEAIRHDIDAFMDKQAGINPTLKNWLG